jgi:hypothetical protein
MQNRKPTRSKVRRFEGGPQGDAAWLSVRKILYGERKSIIDEFNELMKKFGMDTLQDGDEIAASLSSLPDAIDIDYELAQFFAQFVTAWNWVDDDGNPLPLPCEDDTVLAKLYGEEVSWINECTAAVVFGNELEKK